MLGVSMISLFLIQTNSCVVTCGEDRVIKVWDAVTGAKQYTFEGHEAPVYSVVLITKKVFSASTTMAYSADGTRLFSCGTNKEGESFLVEWSEGDGAVKRTYHGLGKRSLGVVQFDTTKNRFS